MTRRRGPDHQSDGAAAGRRRPANDVMRMQLKGSPGRSQRFRPAPLPPPHARPITALMTDGGTKFGLHTHRETWHPEFNRLVDWLLEKQRQYADPSCEPDLDDLPNLLMPLPTLPLGYSRGLDAVLQPAMPPVDYRTRGFGHTGATGAPVAIVGLRGSTITFHFRDRAFVRLMRRQDKDGNRTWYIHVEAKHRELYARGLQEWLRTWLGYFSWLTSGDWLEPYELRAAGWSTTQWHLNADFVGTEWVAEDAADFTCVRKRTLYGRLGEDDDDDIDEPDPLEDLDPVDVGDDFDDPADLHRANPNGWLQTWEAGRQTGDLQIVGYKKGDEQRESKGLDPAASAYAVHWREFGGWDPVVDGDPFRVEIRARKKGLLYRPEGSMEVLYDFRDPAQLLDVVAQQTFWLACTTRRRLVQRTHAKQRTCPTDARWKIVQLAAGFEPRAAIRQFPHKVAELTRVERVLKARKKAFDALQDLALVEHGVGLEHADDFAAALRELADRLRAGTVGIDKLGEGVLAHAWDPGKTLKRKPAQVEFYSEELVDRVEPYQDELRARGGLGGISVFEILGPPIVRSANDPPPPRNPFDLPSPTD